MWADTRRKRDARKNAQTHIPKRLIYDDPSLKTCFHPKKTLYGWRVPYIFYFLQMNGDIYLFNLISNKLIIEIVIRFNQRYWMQIYVVDCNFINKALPKFSFDLNKHHDNLRQQFLHQRTEWNSFFFFIISLTSWHTTIKLMFSNTIVN